MAKATILIPTSNRPNYLKRALDYYSKYGKGYSLIIADSSIEKNKKINKKTASSFPEMSIKYIGKYIDEVPFTHSYKKIVDALSYVKEKYCVICADDDFIIPNGINKCVEFLESNQDFTVALGYFISFDMVENKQGKNFCWFPMYSHKPIIFSDAESRLKAHLSNPSQSTYYGVHRTDFLKMAFGEAVKYTDDDRFGELLPSMLDIIYGNLKCLDILYAARAEISNSGRFTTKDFGYFIKKGTYGKKYSNFRNCLIKHLAEKSKINPQNTKKLIDDAMAAFLSSHFKAKKAMRKDTRIHKIRDTLIHLKMPKWIYEGIRLAYRTFFLPHLTKRIREYRKIVSLYSKDFDNINDIVFLHAENIS